jgi:hypothetical protein
MEISEFSENLFKFVGDGVFDRTQARLLYYRYAAPKIAYTEFCKMIVPVDEYSADRLLSRVPRGRSLTCNLVDDMRRLFRAMLSLE